MKKKLLLLITLALVLAVGTAVASPVHPGGWGIGALWGGNIYDGNINNNVALSLKAPTLPVFWGIRLGIGDDFWLGLQGDIYIMGAELIPTLYWFLGIGAFGNFWFGDEASIGFGARLPIGLTWQPLDLLEVFINLAPQLGGHIYTGSGGGFTFPHGGFLGFEFGIRVWL